MTDASSPFHAILDGPQTFVTNAQSGPLTGLTLTVKDIFDVAGSDLDLVRLGRRILHNAGKV